MAILLRRKAVAPTATRRGGCGIPNARAGGRAGLYLYGWAVLLLAKAGGRGALCLYLNGVGEVCGPYH